MEVIVNFAVYTHYKCAVCEIISVKGEYFCSWIFDVIVNGNFNTFSTLKHLFHAILGFSA